MLVDLKEFPVTFEIMSKVQRQGKLSKPEDFLVPLREALMEISGMQHLTDDTLNLMLQVFLWCTRGCIWFTCPKCPQQRI